MLSTTSYFNFHVTILSALKKEINERPVLLVSISGEEDLAVTTEGKSTDPSYSAHPHNPGGSDIATRYLNTRKNMSNKKKILVCGDVEGNFKTLFSRVDSINEKSGPFDFLFCVGDFFSDSLKKLEPYRNGSLAVPVPTYVLGPNKENHVSFYEDLNEGEICPNVNFLGKHGIFSSGGIKIAYVSGIEGKGNASIFFGEKEAAVVRDAANRRKDGARFLGVDVLLSSQWPKGVSDVEGNSESSEVLARLACQLKPRYHFSGLRNVFYERAPYKNCSENQSETHSTRFIGLAKVGSVGKNKWIYAANLTPLSEIKGQDLYRPTTDETPCPYSAFSKEGNRKNATQFFYDVNAQEYSVPEKRKKRNFDEKEKQKRSFDDPETCWFCLASSCVEKHLVVSIGEEVYLALAKGGLVPGHVMIVPIKHHRAQTELPKNAGEEVNKYKSRLRKLFQNKDQALVVFERNYKTSHFQLHAIPVPSRVAPRLRELFFSFSEEQGLELSELPSKARLKDFIEPGAPYFYLELPTNEKFLCCCRKSFPINFGRDVLASKAALDLPHRVNWRDCVQSKEEEQKMAQNFRTEFEEFDEFSSRS